jgi:hypothetical protein
MSCKYLEVSQRNRTYQLTPSLSHRFYRFRSDTPYLRQLLYVPPLIAVIPLSFDRIARSRLYIANGCHPDVLEAFEVVLLSSRCLPYRVVFVGWPHRVFPCLWQLSSSF